MKTAHKLALASAAYRFLGSLRRAVGRDDRVRAARQGVEWQLDLAEGIDFAIYVGQFEPELARLWPVLLRDGAVALDIGANVGAHTLPLAQAVGEQGRVFAFEPTEYAVAKLRANLALNPSLQRRITVCQAMLAAEADAALPSDLYSSWPLGGKCDVHEQHGGRLMATRGAEVLTLDAVLDRFGVERLDLVKLDVDGHEYAVLRGAKGVLARLPVLVLELAPYLHGAEFELMLELLWSHGYELADCNKGMSLPRSTRAIGDMIPRGASLNVVAARAEQLASILRRTH